MNSSLPSYAVAIIIVVVAAQYALALFCLLKLAYLDIPKKQYVLWNLLILIVFFIGAAVFLVYYSKVKDTKKIPPYVEEPENKEPEQPDAAVESEQDEKSGLEKTDDVPEEVGQEEKDGGAENADSEKTDNSDTPKD